MAIEKTVSELAEILGVSRQAINNRVKALPEEDTTKNEKGVTVVTRSGLLNWKRYTRRPFLRMNQLAKTSNSAN